MDANAIIESRTKRTRWFLDDRFGMFIHWGLYSIPARGEWIRSFDKTSNEEYHKYFEEFNPVKFDPEKWAALAKKARMKYAVLTAKHHDGFCLFDSQLTDYKSTNTKIGKDLVKEYLQAFRKEGIKVGLYYSLLDWHHDHYPAYGDRHHPMRENKEYKDKPYNFSKYLKYMQGQIRELLTNYGKLDIMWFDFSYDNMTAETWKATELMDMIQSLQPHLITDNRLDASGEYGGSIMTGNPTVYSGDFASPEQIIPPEGVVDDMGNSIPWEACITLNNNWGYHSSDHLYKSSKLLIRKLVECVSKNGNMLLNVGPDAKGEIPEESVKILEEIGRWMSTNGESIYGCQRAEFAKPEWGRYTQKGKKLYAHIFDESIGPINLNGLGGRIKKARLLKDGSELALINPWNTKEYKNDAFINFGIPEYYTFPLPDEIDSVVELELI